MKKIHVVTFLASLCFCCACNVQEEEFPKNSLYPVKLVTKVEASYSDLKESALDSYSLGAKSIQIFKKKEGEYAYLKSIVMRKYGEHPEDPNENPKLELENGEYLLNVLLYREAENPWTHELIEVGRTYDWTFNERRLPDHLYENGVPALAIWNSDLFIGQVKFEVSDAPVHLNVTAKRCVGKIDLTSTTDLPEDWERIEFDLRTSSVIDISSNTVLADKRQVKWLIARELLEDVPATLNYSRFCFPCKDASLTVRVWKKESGDRIKLSETRVEHIDIVKGKVTHLKGNWFQTFSEEELQISMEGEDYWTETILF